MQRMLRSRARRVTLGLGIALGLAGTALGGQVTKVALLNGDQENPPVATDAAGCARIEIDTEANTLSYVIAWSGFGTDELFAHIHGPADIGENAGVLHTLPNGSPKVGTWTYDESLEADILAGRTYINIHSQEHGSGELRGQIVDLVAIIDGAQETPEPVDTPGGGYGLFNIDRCAGTLDYHITYALDPDSTELFAHIHGFAVHTEGAGVLHTLPTTNPKVGTWNFAADQLDGILAGRTYVNIHSDAVPSGEIRGQVCSTVVPLDPSQEVPPVDADGHGCALISLRQADRTFGYYLAHQDLTGPAQAAHVHGYADPGSNAGVVHNIGPAVPAVGTWTYPMADASELFADRAYFNVHTAANPGGEVRGQIVFPLERCSAEIVCDGTVDTQDLLALLGDFGPCGSGEDCPADLNGDGTVDTVDLLTLLSNWGACP